MCPKRQAEWVWGKVPEPEWERDLEWAQAEAVQLDPE
jgi:hypothetical protein